MTEVICVVAYFLVGTFFFGSLTAQDDSNVAASFWIAAIWPVSIAVAIVWIIVYAVFCAGDWCGKRFG